MAPVRPREGGNGTGAINTAVGEGQRKEAEVREEAMEAGEEEGERKEAEDREEAMEAEEEEGEEAEAVRLRKAPNQPSDKELEEHMVTHVPYRPWCPFCVAGKSKANPHRKRGDRDVTMPEVHMDYTFMKTREEEGKKGMPILVAKDRDSKWVMASVVPKKGRCAHACSRLEVMLDQ